MFLPPCERQNFTPKQNNSKNCSSVYFNLYIFLANWKTKDFTPKDIKHFPRKIIIIIICVLVDILVSFYVVPFLCLCCVCVILLALYLIFVLLNQHLNNKELN
jgi:Flp pilus assembly protein TadB